MVGSVASPKSQGPSSRVPSPRAQESQVPGSWVLGLESQSHGSQGPGTQVLILDYA